jgi:hypothetical protein
MLKAQEMSGRYSEGTSLIATAGTGRPHVDHCLKTFVARAGVRTHW